MPNNRPLAPLRRLSVVLRLSEAYSPTHVLPPTPSSRSPLSAYLANVKASYLKDIKEDPKKGAGWTVVMGNEAGGMIVCFTVSV
jgi:exopolyphosphatase